MSKTQLVKYVRILSRQVCEKHLRFIYLLPDLLNDTSGRKDLVPAHGLEAGLFDGWNENLLVVNIVPLSERHHDKATVEELAHPFLALVRRADSRLHELI